MKNKTIILRMTNACNLDCKYCYDKNNHNTTRKENEKFNSRITYIVDYISKIWKNKNEEAEIIFHGGEPLIISPTNYIDLIERIKAIFPLARFSLQTNSLLINQEYINIFKKFKVHLGISLDGYDANTNKYRVYKNGKNSFEDVIKKINMLNSNNVRFGIIMTVNKSVIGNELNLYDFIKKYNLNCNIRPAFKCSEEELDYMTSEEYYTFFKNLFNIWIDDKEAKVRFNQIKEIKDEFIKALEPNYNNKSCSSSECCFNNFISLDINGNIYSCNRTYNNQNFFYGNLEKSTMEEIEEKIKIIGQKRKGYISKSKCKNCILFDECYGGCPANAFSLHEEVESIDDSFCDAKVRIRLYIKEYLEKNNIKNEYIEMRKNE